LGLKRNEVTGEWRKLRNEELDDLYSSSNITCAIKSRRMKWTELVTRMKGKRGAYRGLVGRPEGKRLLGSFSENSVSRAGTVDLIIKGLTN
jgi:hypothetical protein